MESGVSRQADAASGPQVSNGSLSEPLQNAGAREPSPLVTAENGTFVPVTIRANGQTGSASSNSSGQQGRDQPATEKTSTAISNKGNVPDYSSMKRRVDHQSMERALPKIKPPLVELQIETTSRIGSRLIFGIWYAVLLAALILQGIIKLQWQCKSICNQVSCSLDDVTSFDSWSCANGTNLTTTSAPALPVITFAPGEQPGNVTNAPPPPPPLAQVVWHGGFTTLYDTALNRFVNLIYTMPRPNSSTPKDESLSLSLQFSLTVVSQDPNVSDVTKALFPLTITCAANERYCETVVLPNAATSINNNTNFLLTVHDAQQDVARAAMNASIGAVYQKRSYTITTIAMRYTMLVISLVHFIRFLYHKKFKNALYEQTWIIFLHVGLVLYLNPLFAAGVYAEPEGPFLSFLEFRPPTYFMALLVAFMFSLITSSMAWSGTEMSYHPPTGAKVAAYTFVAMIFIIDIVDASLHDFNWASEHCPNFRCNPAGYTLYSALALGTVICSVWLVWLRSNLGKKPYLSSRPQQLAMRLFIFMFSTLVVYFIMQALIVLWWYSSVSTIVSYQSLLQVGPLLVVFTFVQLMTYAYTTTVRSHRVPVHPTDPRWKRRVWPTAWFQWLSLHGGSMYLFLSEAEQDSFDLIQLKYHESPELYESQAIPASAGGVGLISVRYSDSEEDVSESTALRTGGGESRKDTVGDDMIPSCSFDDAAAADAPKGEGRESSARRSRAMTRIISAQKAVQSTAGKVQQSVTHLLVDRPAALIDRIEDRIIDVADLLTGVASRRKPFFNLETAMDCFNLSWEAYGVSASKGDVEVTTGYQFDIAATAVVGNIPIINRCCRCCISKDDEFPDEDLSLPSATPLSNRSMATAATPSSRTGSLFGDNQGLNLSGTYMLPTSPKSRTASVAPSAPPIDVEQYGYVRVAVFEGLDVQVVISERALDVTRHRGKGPRLVVAFRGTDNLNNAKQDVMIKRVAWSEMEASLWETSTYNKPSVHVGFLMVWNALREQVMNVIATRVGIGGGEHEVVVTGHSLGGAISVLASYVIAKYLRDTQHPKPDVKVYTFGMPRVGNASFRAAYEKMVPNMFRVVNESDAVSHISIMGGSHVGMEVDVDRHGNFICEPMFIESVFRPTKGKGSAIAHHSMKAYADSLNAVAECGLGWCPSRCLVPYTTQEERERLALLSKANEERQKALQDIMESY